MDEILYNQSKTANQIWLSSIPFEFGEKVYYSAY